jgi:hypothetical protein
MVLAAAVWFSANDCRGAHVDLQFAFPQGGEVLVAGTPQTVTFLQTRQASVVVELSTDGGTTFTQLGSVTPMKNVLPRLAFTVPNTPSTNCVLRAIGTTKGKSVTATTAAFNIFAAGAPLVIPGPGTVGTAALADGSVTNPKLAPLAVSNDKITSGQASDKFVLTADGIGNAAFMPLVLPQGLGTSDTPTFGGINLPPGSIPASSLASSGLFGDGSDGDLNVDGATFLTLTADKYFNNLTLQPGATIQTNGFRIFVRGTLINNGVIHNNGLGSGGGIQGLPGGGTGTLGGGGTSGFGGGSGSAPTAGEQKVFSLGGSGGLGGSLTARGPNVVPPVAAEGGTNVLSALPLALTCRTITGAQITGGGGGDGGAFGTQNGSSGGGGGGVVMVAARTITGSGSVQARGGAGGVRTSAGGGGGGGGGVVVIVSTGPLPTGITVNVDGGAAGTGTVGTPQPGSPGKMFVIF